MRAEIENRRAGKDQSTETEEGQKAPEVKSQRKKRKWKLCGTLDFAETLKRQLKVWKELKIGIERGA